MHIAHGVEHLGLGFDHDESIVLEEVDSAIGAWGGKRAVAEARHHARNADDHNYQKREETERKQAQAGGPYHS